MLICQPTQTTINASDFQNGTYTFSVESTVEAVLSPGRLIVSVSTGYSLTTSSTSLSRREHTFEHNQQTNGTWLATGRVTVICKNEIPTDGTIVIQNSRAESVVLTIKATSDSVERSLLPVLATDSSTLAFAPTTPDKPSYLVFTIRPQLANTPVTLTTDSPDVFQLASNSRPHFGPALTVTPSPVGTYVHVRYISSKPGMHSGKLLIHTGSEIKSVAVTAHTNRLLSDMLMQARQPALTRLWAGLGTMLIVAILAFAGYSNRCQLFPALCQDRIADSNTINTYDTDSPALHLKKDIVSVANKPDKPGRTQKNRTKPPRLLTRSLSKRDTVKADVSILAPEPTAVNNSHQPKELAPNTDKSKPTIGQATQLPIVAPTYESELERALNHPIPN